jgi:hypothetical protein
MDIVIKMASDSEVCYKQRAVIEFLVAEEEECWEYSQASEEY